MRHLQERKSRHHLTQDNDTSSKRSSYLQILGFRNLMAQIQECLEWVPPNQVRLDYIASLET